MALKDDIALLTTVPLFADLTDEQIRLLAFGAEHRRVPEGHVLFRQGTQADCGYVVSDGSLTLSIADRDSAKRVVKEAGRGVLLGELAMIRPVPRKFTAEAAVDSEVIRITRPLFARMLEEYPAIATVMMKRIQSNLSRVIGDLDRIERRFKS